MSNSIPTSQLVKSRVQKLDDVKLLSAVFEDKQTIECQTELLSEVILTEADAKKRYLEYQVEIDQLNENILGLNQKIGLLETQQLSTQLKEQIVTEELETKQEPLVSELVQPALRAPLSSTMSLMDPWEKVRSARLSRNLVEQEVQTEHIERLDLQFMVDRDNFVVGQKPFTVSNRSVAPAPLEIVAPANYKPLFLKPPRAQADQSVQASFNIESQKIVYQPVVVETDDQSVQTSHFETADQNTQTAPQKWVKDNDLQYVIQKQHIQRLEAELYKLKRKPIEEIEKLLLETKEDAVQTDSVQNPVLTLVSSEGETRQKPPIPVANAVRQPIFSEIPSISLPSARDIFTYRQPTERSDIIGYVDQRLDSEMFSDIPTTLDPVSHNQLQNEPSAIQESVSLTESDEAVAIPVEAPVAPYQQIAPLNAAPKSQNKLRVGIPILKPVSVQSRLKSPPRPIQRIPDERPLPMVKLVKAEGEREIQMKAPLQISFKPKKPVQYQLKGNKFITPFAELLRERKKQRKLKLQIERSNVSDREIGRAHV